MKIFCIFCANSKSWTYITSIFYFELPRYGKDVTPDLTCDHPMWLQIIHYTVLYWHLVAGKGFEPLASRLWAWRATSALPRNVIGCERVGFEPTTSGLWDQRATRLLHPAIYYIYISNIFLKNLHCHKSNGSLQILKSHNNLSTVIGIYYLPCTLMDKHQKVIVTQTGSLLY